MIGGGEIERGVRLRGCQDIVFLVEDPASPMMGPYSPKVGSVWMSKYLEYTFTKGHCGHCSAWDS